MNQAHAYEHYFSETGVFEAKLLSPSTEQESKIIERLGFLPETYQLFEFDQKALINYLNFCDNNFSFSIGKNNWEFFLTPKKMFRSKNRDLGVYNLHIPNLPKSRGMFNISDLEFNAIIYDGINHFTIESYYDEKGNQKYILYERQPLESSSLVQVTNPCLKIELAFEVDSWAYENYVNYNSLQNMTVDKVRPYLTSRIYYMLEPVNYFYEGYFENFEIKVTDVFIREMNNGYNYSSAVNIFKSINAFWWENRPLDCVPRDARVLLTGKHIPGGSIQANGVRFCSIAAQGFPQDRPAIIMRIDNTVPVAGGALTNFAHELGHLLIGGLHIDEWSNPPSNIDYTQNLMVFGGPGQTLDNLYDNTSANDPNLNPATLAFIDQQQSPGFCNCLDVFSDNTLIPDNFEYDCPIACILDISVTADNLHPVPNCYNEDLVNYVVKVGNICNSAVDYELRFNNIALAQQMISIDPNFNSIPIQQGSQDSYVSNGTIHFAPLEYKYFYFSGQATGQLAGSSNTYGVFCFVPNEPYSAGVSVTPGIDFIDAIGTEQNPKLFSDLLIENPLTVQGGLWDSNNSCIKLAKENIYVNSFLEIDLDNIASNTYCFNTMTFKMANDAKIIITGTGEVNFDNCKFISCDEMWRSVEVGPNAKAAFNNCEIEFGKEAIKLLGGAETNITNCKFRDNYISIIAEKGTNTNPTDIIALYGNTFEKMDGLLTPYAGEKPYAGIEANGLKHLDVGWYGKDPNIFQKLENGILAYNTNLRVINSEFKNINAWDENLPFPQPPVEGTYAIYAKTDPGLTRTLKVTGYGKDNMAMFSNCQSAVGFERMVGRITQCKMENVVFGVSALNNQYRVFDISDNHIEASGIGISLLHNTPAQGKILDNIIDINDNLYNLDRAIGIRISEKNNGIANYNYYDIEENEINLQEGKAGIELLAGKYVDLEGNTINLAYDRKQAGIYTAASTKALIKCNTINGSAGENLTQESKGIDVFSTFSSVISCNTTSGTYYGMDFNGSDDDIHLKGNNLYQHSVGLQIEATGAIGEQNHRGNRWHGPFSGWGARHLGLPNIISQSQFFVDANASSGQSFNYLPSAIQATGQWFVDQTSGEIFQCQVSEADYCSKSGDAWQIIPGDGEDIFTTVSGTDYSGLGNAFAWNNKNHVYEQFREVYSSSQADLYSQSRYLNQDNIPELHNIKNNLGQLMQVDPTINANLTQQQDQIDITISALQQNARNIEAEVAGALSQRTVLLNQLEADIITGDGYANTIQTEIYNGLPAIITGNQSISSTDIYVQNEQTVNDIFLRTVAAGNINIPVYFHSTIWNIANQCPLTGGEAVFIARSLYTLIDPLTAYDYDLICQGVSPFEKQIVELQPQEPAFSLSPNPANGYVVIHLKNIKEGNLEVQLINTYGQIIKTEQRNAENKPLFIETDRLEKGIYFCKIRLNSESIGTKKLILIK